MAVLQMFFALCSMSKTLEKCGKMKISGGIKVFLLSIQKVSTKYGIWFLKTCGNPALYW